jgi:hypothetical protein
MRREGVETIIELNAPGACICQIKRTGCRSLVFAVHLISIMHGTDVIYVVTAHGWR